MLRPLYLTAAAMVTTLCFSFAAEKEESFGHSYHGEAFNEGPRQEAVLMEGMGNVSFEVTTESREAQVFFNQGVGQLYGFWDFEAERSFRQVAALDPDCAMAYWGMAMANHGNDERAKGFTAEAVERSEGASAKEQMWIKSIETYYEYEMDGRSLSGKERRSRFVGKLRELEEAFPKDLDAKALLLMQIWRNSQKGVSIENMDAADSLAVDVLKAQEDHPIHHFKIHLWDKKSPEKAIESAALCGSAAPGIAHMWHMPGHIYSKLKRYGDAAWHQEASARIDHAHMMRYRIVPDDIHNFAHNNEWLVRNLVMLGRAEEAINLARNMIELPRLPKFKKDTEEYEHAKGSWSYGRLRLRDTLIRFQMWERLMDFGQSDYLAAGNDGIDDVEWNRFMGMAAYRSGKTEKGAEHLAFLEKVLEEESEAQDKKELEKKKVIRARERRALAKTLAKRRGARDELKVCEEESEAQDKKELEKKELEKKKVIRARERGALAKTLAKRRGARDELKVCSLIFGPEPDMEEALKILREMDRIDLGHQATLMLAASDAKAAVKLAEEGVAARPSEVEPLARQVAILWEAGEKDAAMVAFEELRILAASADENLPVFDRLKPVVESLNIEGDWKVASEPADDIGERPDLDSLGPFRWQAPEAPSFSLPNADGELVSLADYRGRPVLVIFYLGRGCTHCMEQLTAFSPMQEKYAEAGIDIVAVSTDSPEGLKITYRISTDEAENPFPFPLLSDAEFGMFKEYRAYDDFEKMALHGTFLIDGKGKVRWQEIGPEPFMHPTFLLEECERLLGFDGAMELSGR